MFAGIMLTLVLYKAEVFTQPGCPPCKRLKADFAKASDYFEYKSYKQWDPKYGEYKGAPTIIFHKPDGNWTKVVGYYGKEATLKYHHHGSEIRKLIE